MNIKVRGIYSTALIKILIDLGYNISNPSEKQIERFNIDFEGVPDLYIFDTRDREGIMIYGDEKNVEKIVDDFRKIFWDSFFVKTNLGKILKGKKIGEEREYYVYQTELGNVFVKKIEEPKEEENLQIKKVNDKIYASKYIKIKGEYVDVLKYGKNIIDFRIKNEKRRELENFLKLIKREGWGIKLKKSCEKGSYEDILEELNRIFDRNPVYFKIIFGLRSKILMDKERGKICKTVPFHHILRVEYSDIVDFLENSDIVIENFEKNIFKFFAKKIRENMLIKRHHKKILEKGFSRIEIVENVSLGERLEVITKYPIQGEGLYDGLGIKKEKGDYAKIKYSFGSEIIETTYYDRGGKEKGRYFNINSPVEIVGNKIKYYDLEVDVVEIEGNRKIIDTEKFKKLKENKIITEKYYKHILDLLDSMG